jgi:ubiquinone/menaquinone biosynthesis C-methylase UbiE
LGRGERVLDVGCGDGSMARIIQNAFRCAIEGTDITNLLKHDMPFKLMKNDEQLPYRNKSFDVVMLNDVLHHTRKTIQILRESVRVGRTVLIFETKPTIMAKVVDYVLNWYLYSDMPIPLTHKCMDEWLKILGDLRLEVEHREFPARIYPLTHYSFRARPRHD